MNIISFICCKNVENYLFCLFYLTDEGQLFERAIKEFKLFNYHLVEYGSGLLTFGLSKFVFVSSYKLLKFGLSTLKLSCLISKPNTKNHY